MKLPTLAAMVSLSLAGIGQSHAYVYTTCLGEKVKWGSNSAQLRGNAVSFPAGYWFSGLQDTVNKFNRNPSRFRYSLVSEGGGVGIGNGQNEVWGSTDQGVLQGAPAIAYTSRTCYWFFGDHVHMDEVDVIFDYTNTVANPFEWTADTTKSSLIRYTGSGRAIQTTGIHEFGHGLKLKHVNTEYNVMGSDFEHIHVNGSTATAYLGEDAADGAVFLYSETSSTHEDLGVVHWKYLGASGEYSDHTKTKVYNSADGNLSTINIGGETGYIVSAGQVVRVEFTYENNGKNTQNNVDVGFYISTNDLISTFDTRIGGTTLTLGRGDVYTARHTVTIPANLYYGTNYWIGAVIDEDGSLAEATEVNNATYIPLRVQ